MRPGIHTLLWTKPTSLSHNPARRLPVNYMYTHRHHWNEVSRPKQGWPFTRSRPTNHVVDCEVVSRVVVSVSNVSVSRRSRGIFSNVSVSSQYRHSKVSVSSRLLTSRLHRTTKFKLRNITIKFILYSLQRFLGCLSISVENRHFCLFLNYELFNTIAIKNMNVMDVIKAWYALISASGTTNNVSK